MWLFYVQHQFEHTVWSGDRELELPDGGAPRQLALRSAGRAALVHRQYRRAPHPSPVQPHSILPAAARASPAPRSRRMSAGSRCGKVSACVRLVLWDEAARRLISFRELRSRIAARQSARRAFCLIPPCKGHAYLLSSSDRHLAGQSGRFAFAECQAHVQTLQTSTNRVSSRADRASCRSSAPGSAKGYLHDIRAP